MANQVTTFAITDTTLYVPVLTSSTHDNAKLSHNWNQDLKEELTEININRMVKAIFRLPNGSTFLGSK